MPWMQIQTWSGCQFGAMICYLSINPGIISGLQSHLSMMWRSQFVQRVFSKSREKSRLVFNMTHPEISQRPPQLCGSFILFLCVIINHQNNNLCKRLFPFIHSINNSWRELLVRPANVSGRDRGNNYQTSGEPCVWKLGECKEYDRPVWIIWGNYFYFIYKNRKIACVQVLESFC